MFGLRAGIGCVGFRVVRVAHQAGRTEQELLIHRCHFKIIEGAAFPSADNLL